MEEIIGCLPWRFRSLAPQLRAVKRVCADCGEDVVMQAGNAEAAKSMLVVCMPCLFLRCPNLLKEAGGIIDGQKIRDLRTALRAAQAAENRN